MQGRRSWSPSHLWRAAKAACLAEQKPSYRLTRWTGVKNGERVRETERPSIKRGRAGSNSAGFPAAVEVTRRKAPRIVRAECLYRHPWRRFWPRAFQATSRKRSRCGGARGATRASEIGRVSVMLFQPSKAVRRVAARLARKARAHGWTGILSVEPGRAKSLAHRMASGSANYPESQAAPSLVRWCVVQGCAILGYDGSRSASDVVRY